MPYSGFGVGVLGAAVLVGASPCFAEGRSGPEIFSQKCANCHKGGSNSVVGKGSTVTCPAVPASRIVLSGEARDRKLPHAYLVGSTGAGVWTLQTDALQRYGYDDVDSVSAGCPMSCVSVCPRPDLCALPNWSAAASLADNRAAEQG